MICRRCGREQPSLHSPCPECGREAGSVSLYPGGIPEHGNGSEHGPPVVGAGEAEPQSMSRELRLVFARAHRGWTARYQPHLLESWLAYQREIPSSTTVVLEFGTWNAGIAAAGFQPLAPHGGGGNSLRRRKVAA